MPTDAKTSQPIFGHHASLYSRNRRPFAVTNDDPIASKQTATSVTIVAAGDLNDSINDATAGQNGYATGNAQWLHVQLENDAVKNLTLYGYNYAFGAWAQLFIYIGVGDTETVQQAYKIATVASVSGKKLIQVPIHGIDRIAFTSADAGNMVVRAAASTF